jgi:putative two-component system response regulator
MSKPDIYSNKLSILIVDDDAQQRLLLQMLLEKGNYDIFQAVDGEEALEIFSENPSIRLIITDLDMPNMNGFELIETIREKQHRYTYIIVLTSIGNKASLLSALSKGADDFLTKPAMEEELQLRIENGIRLLREQGQEELIVALAKLAEYRSDETGFHLERVQLYTHLLAIDLAENCTELKITPTMADEISRVSPLHDIGKVAIADNILHKPGKLTTEEFETMKTHARLGGAILEEIYLKTESPYLQIAFELTAYHHEKYNGKGYPTQLAGEDIPIAARIMALADVYDALTSKRCYKDAFSHETARNIILKERGEHFDPKVVDSFLRQEDIWISVRNKFEEG